MNAEPSGTRVSLIVLYTERVQECVRFYQALGLDFTAERHGTGPEHFAAVLADGAVFEIYPPRDGHTTGPLWLGLTLAPSQSRALIASGTHILTDPDGRAVQVLAPEPEA
ncbi:catechol 2,3-dioxygenase-like lactoylglutathione lyase family enzyme [Catenulispora sp. GAS73]|uniref:glyoxalase/bleomycin resistance/dioxygenase family protein n=1 Tax=Catenulispora sp. GAS73 TaxID=3156269 RepID=UPI0035122743